MHIVILASFAPSLINFRGALICDLRAAGHRVSVGAPGMAPETRAQLEELGAKAHETPLDRNGIGLVSDVAYFRSLLALMRRLRPDVALTYTIKPNIWGAFAAAAAGTPSVAMVTGLGFAFEQGRRAGLKGRLAAWGGRRLYRAATRHNRRVIFQNPDDRDDFLAAGCLQDPSKIGMVDGSGVDMAHFARAPRVDAPVFLMMARLIGAKGVREYVEAAQILRARHPQARCLLVGPHDGGPDAIPQREVASWVAKGAVEYLGPAKDVRPFIAQSSVYALPSYREGTPRSVLEAMSMGRAIITTDAPGCRETIRDGQEGFLVPPRDPQALAQAMERLALDPALVADMGERAWRRAAEKYSVDRVNRQMMALMGL